MVRGWSGGRGQRIAAQIDAAVAESRSICVCVYELTPYTRIDINGETEVAPPTPTFLGPTDRPAVVLLVLPHSLHQS